MTKGAIHLTAARAARALQEMVAPALLPHEHRDFFEEAYRICRSLIEACKRQAGRDRIRLMKPSDT